MLPTRSVRTVPFNILCFTRQTRSQVTTEELARYPRPSTMSASVQPRIIYIIGPQSTGKTTLVNELRSGPDRWSRKIPVKEPEIITEVARSILLKRKFNANDITLSEEQCLTLQRLILEAQAEAESKALEHSDWFISDRSGIDPLVYARRYASAQRAAELQRLDAWAEVKVRMADSLIVVCESGTPWLADDGVRLMPQGQEDWLKLFEEFCAMLDELGLQYCVVPKTMLDLSERAKFVRQSWAERCGV